MMTNTETEAGRRVNEQIARYLDNPIKNPRRAAAVREVNEPMAKKARSAAQKAATARMLAAAAAKRGEELEENPMAAKKKKKSKKSKSKTKRKAKTKKATKRAAAKTRKSPKRKRKAKAKASGIPFIAGPTAAKPKKRRAKKKAKAKAKRKKTTRRAAPKRSKAKTTRTQGKAHIIKLKGAPKVQYVEVVEKKRPKKRRKKKLMENPASLALAAPSAVGSFGGLFENPMGALSKDSLVSFAWAASGTAIGLAVARITDRLVATRKPGKSKNGVEGKHAWLGRDAAAMINRRPDAMRLGAQGVGALAAMIGAYTARNVRVLPWALGGIALGFGSNLLLLVLEWMVLPKILKVDPKDPKTSTEGLGGFGNRVLPMEQDYVQDELDKQLEDWAALTNLAAAQAGEKPTAASPLALPSNVYTLGEGPGGTPRPLSQAVGGLIPTGRVGECVSCGGQGGCYSGCPEVQNCGPCSEGASELPDDGGGRKCTYIVQVGDHLPTLLSASGTLLKDIMSLNNGDSPEQFWRPGHEVTLPYTACVEVVRRLPPPLRQQIPDIPVREPTPDIPNIPNIPVREPTPSIPVREPSPDRPVQLVRANLPSIPSSDRPVQLTRANLPSSYVPKVVAGVPDDDNNGDAERERRLRNIGRDETE